MIKLKFGEKSFVDMSLQMNSTCRFLGIEQAGIWTPLTLCSSLAPQSSAISENSTTPTRHKNSPVFSRTSILGEPVKCITRALQQILMLIPGTSTPQRARKIYNSYNQNPLLIPGTLSELGKFS